MQKCQFIWFDKCKEINVLYTHIKVIYIYMFLSLNSQKCIDNRRLLYLSVSTARGKTPALNEQTVNADVLEYSESNNTLVQDYLCIYYSI